MSDIQEALASRFLRYSAISSQSDASQKTIPTSEGQWELARLLKSELEEACAADIHLSETCVLTAKIPATSDKPFHAIGFCTHLDTVDVNLSPVVKAQLLDYAGGDVLLNQEKDIWLRAEEHPEITRYAGQKILFTDGTSVLGADDKAGVTTVMETAVRLLADTETEHGDIYLSFVPDEEIGLLGVRTMDLDRFPVDYAYTLDSCEEGEIVEATFNAGHATISITGVTAHPMNSKGNLVNPILVAHDIIEKFDREETPEHTEGREAYIWVNSIEGNQATASVGISIRDHDFEGYEEKKDRIRAICDYVAGQHPKAKTEVEIQDIYGNIEDAKTPENAFATRHIFTALEDLEIRPINLAMRGGTDGSWLSRQGIFTPNFFTGAHNFHSIYEFLPLSSFEKSFRVVNRLIELAAKE